MLSNRELKVLCESTTHVNIRLLWGQGILNLSPCCLRKLYENDTCAYLVALGSRNTKFISLVFEKILYEKRMSKK